MEAYRKNDTNDFKMNSTLFLELLMDMDELLGSNEHFLLGKWLNSAKTVPNATVEDIKLYEFNAKNQITLWVSQLTKNFLRICPSPRFTSQFVFFYFLQF